MDPTTYIPVTEIDLPRRFHIYIACRLVAESEERQRLQTMGFEVTPSDESLLTFLKKLIISSHLQDYLQKTEAESPTEMRVKAAILQGKVQNSQL